MSENIAEEFEAELKATEERIEEAVVEMKESNSLTDILNQKTKYAEREVITYLNYDAAIEAFELQEEIDLLNASINNTPNTPLKSIVDEDGTAELVEERDKLTERLVALNDVIQDSRAVWTVRGVAPKVWKTIDKMARQKYPITKDANEHIKNETEIERNDYVNIETIRKGLHKVEFADGRTVTEFTHEDIKHFYDNLPLEITMAVKAKVDELTFANRDFQQQVESADFLSNS